MPARYTNFGRIAAGGGAGRPGGEEAGQEAEERGARGTELPHVGLSSDRPFPFRSTAARGNRKLNG